MSNEKRTAIYGVFASVLLALGVFGVITAEEQAAYGEAGVELLSGASLLMSAIKTWKQRGQEALVTLRLDGTNADKARSFVEALEKLRGAA